MTREEALKVAKPILFNTEMVRAILDGRKTVTRRVVKPQPESKHVYKLGICRDGDKREVGMYGFGSRVCGGDVMYVKPPCLIGDILYVRETWREHSPGFDGLFIYKADYTENGISVKWHPSIHMPKEAARIFLHVTDARVERLQKIGTEDDKNYIAEGAQDKHDFIRIWDSTVKKNVYGWYANPWVWVIKFEWIEVR